MVTAVALPLLILLNAFLLAAPVAAQSSSPSATTKPPITKPSPSPPLPSPTGFQYSNPTKEPADVPSEDINLSLAGILAQSDLIVKIFGHIKPKDDRLDIPNLDRYAQWLERADPYLTPKSIQEQTTNPTNPDPISIASRLCVYNPETGEARQQVSDEPIVSEPQLWPKLLAKNTERLNTYYGRAKRADQNYEGQPIVISEPPACDDQYSGNSQNRTPVRTSGQNSFGGSDNVLSIFLRVTADFANKLLSVVSPPVPAKIKLGTKVPKAADFGCHGPGCTEDDLKTTQLSPEKKGELAKGGFVQTFKPSEVNYKGNPVGMIPNEYEQTIADSDPGSKQTNFFMTKATEDGFTFLKCLLLPKSKQEGTKCQKDWTSEIEEPPAGTLGSLDFPPGLPPIPPSANNPLTYDIPYKNTECRISESLIDVVIDRMRTYYPNEQKVGTQNFRQLWRDVQDEADRGGVNPLFALTLWIEESAAGGAVHAAPMGCMYRGWQDETNVREATLRQTVCLASVANQTQDFLGFMCRYSGEERDRTTNHCNTFTNNPHFTYGVRFWYDFLSQDKSSSCRLRSTLPSQ